MIHQPELSDTALGTLPATFDMCQVGQLHLPGSQKFLRKGTQVHTTSRQLWQELHGHRCAHQHEHEPIEGKYKTKDNWENISTFAQNYTGMFGKRVARVLKQECNLRETPLILEEMILGLEEHERPEMAQESFQLRKRRRVCFKQTEEALYGKAPTWERVFQMAGTRTPRVGNGYFRKGQEPLVDMVQRIVHDMEVHLIIYGRGTDRYRVGGIDLEGNTYEQGDWGSGRFGPPQEWTKMTKLGRIGKAKLSKISLTIFGHPPQGQATSSSLPRVPNKSEDAPTPGIEDPEAIPGFARQARTDLS